MVNSLAKFKRVKKSFHSLLQSRLKLVLHRFQVVVRLRFFRFYLEESKLPTAWYNVRADMKNKPAPLLNPGTLKPMTARELDGVFCDELVQQELDDTTA